MRVELELTCGCCGDINFYHPDDRRLMRWVSQQPELAAKYETDCARAKYQGGPPVFLDIPDRGIILDLGVTWEQTEAFKQQVKILGAVHKAEDSIAKGEGRVITKQSMRELADEVKQRGRQVLKPPHKK